MWGGGELGNYSAGSKTRSCLPAINLVPGGFNAVITGVVCSVKVDCNEPLLCEE
jgi:hypothetical protein